MIISMTGYGKAFAEITGKKLTIEIKSLNSKQLDLSMKLPGIFREKESVVRNFIAQKFERGKIDIFISTEFNGDSPNYSINKVLAKKYLQEIRELASEVGGLPDEQIIPLLIKMPDVLQTSTEGINEGDWNILMESIESAGSQLLDFRTNEGRILEKDILSRINLIQNLLDSIEPYETARITSVRERLSREFENLARTDGKSVIPDQNRFEQELIFYFERLDITEEKVRLKKHCDYFLETMNQPVSQGKKLGFITQEIGREINTIGSKANHAEIQKIVVQMKDELEKVKEQLLNIL